MSIIQDALRRKESPAAGAPTAPPPTPAPAGPPPRPGSFPPPPLPPEPARKPVSPALVVVLAVVLLGAGGFAIHRSGLLGRFASKPAAPEAPGEPAPAAPASPEAGASGGITSAPAASAASPTSSVPDSADHEAPMDPPGQAAPSPGEATPSPGTTTPSTNALPATSTKPPAAVRWPAFTVKGIIAGRAGSGSVIINKTLADVGQTTAEGLRVMRIVEDGVVLEFKGQERMFRVGTGNP